MGLNAPKNPAAVLMGTSPAGICGTPLVACPLFEPAQIVEATVNPPAADTPPFLPVDRQLHPLASLANPPRSRLLLLHVEAPTLPAVDLSSTLPAVLLIKPPHRLMLAEVVHCLPVPTKSVVVARAARATDPPEDPDTHSLE